MGVGTGDIEMISLYDIIVALVSLAALCLFGWWWFFGGTKHK